MLSTPLKNQLDRILVIADAIEDLYGISDAKDLRKALAPKTRPIVTTLIDKGYETTDEVIGAINGILGHQPLHGIVSFDEALDWWHFLRDLRESDLSESYVLAGWIFHPDGMKETA